MKLFSIVIFIVFSITVNAQDSECKRLKESIIQGNQSLTKALIKNTKDIDCGKQEGSSPLGIACSRGEFQIVKALLKKGANPNLMQFYEGKAIGTPLFNAVFIYEQALEPELNLNKRKKNYRYKIKDDITKLLVMKGADVKIVDETKNTVLMVAAMNKRHEIFKLLVDRGVDINAQNIYGNTALMYAVINNDYSSVKLMLDLGADVYIKNKNGITIIDYAKTNSLSQIEILISKFLQ